MPLTCAGLFGWQRSGRRRAIEVGPPSVGAGFCRQSFWPGGVWAEFGCGEGDDVGVGRCAASIAVQAAPVTVRPSQGSGTRQVWWQNRQTGRTKWQRADLRVTGQPPNIQGPSAARVAVIGQSRPSPSRQVRGSNQLHQDRSNFRKTGHYRPADQMGCSWQLVLVSVQLLLAPPRRLATRFGPTPLSCGPLLSMPLLTGVRCQRRRPGPWSLPGRD